MMSHIRDTTKELKDYSTRTLKGLKKVGPHLSPSLEQLANTWACTTPHTVLDMVSLMTTTDSQQSLKKLGRLLASSEPHLLFMGLLFISGGLRGI